MSLPSHTNESYSHIQRVQWPDDLPCPEDWRFRFKPELQLPKMVEETIKRAMFSGVRFYQKAKDLYAPTIQGDTGDPDPIHALQIALDRLAEVANAAKQPQTYDTKPVVRWLQERLKSLVGAMLAVMVAEEGEMYDEANKETWEVETMELTDERASSAFLDRLMYLRFIFHTVMARIDIVPAGSWDHEEIQPDRKEAIRQPMAGNGIWFPPAPSASFWKMDHALRESSNSKMRQAALALYHQGRVMSAGINNIPVVEQTPSPPVFDVMTRAMELTIRSIESVWRERPKELPILEENKLLGWLRSRKNAAADLRLAFVEFRLGRELYGNIVKINNTGEIFVFVNNNFLEWGVGARVLQ